MKDVELFKLNEGDSIEADEGEEVSVSDEA
jgi:recombination protein RecA